MKNTSKADSARKQMNQLGESKIPFFFMIDFEMKKPIISRMDDLDDNILFNFDGFRNYRETPQKKEAFLFEKKPISIEKYEAAFEYVLKEINYGNSFLLNLAFPSEVACDLELIDIFHRSVSLNKIYLKDEFVSFSPEIFIEIKKGLISSYPMKGTIDAGIENAEKILLADQKEKAEHNTIVDLIRNDLSMVSKNVRVEAYRYIDKIQTNHKNLLALSSKITGELDDEFNCQIGDIIFRLLPAGSISGAPKIKTVEIIQEAEKLERGYYTGIAGYFDGDQLYSCVLIRYLEKHGKALRYFSGGGITFQSQMNKEYQELIDKVYVPIY